jgi:hypothetical protein
MSNFYTIPANLKAVYDDYTTERIAIYLTEIKATILKGSNIPGWIELLSFKAQRIEEYLDARKGAEAQAAGWF